MVGRQGEFATARRVLVDTGRGDDKSREVKGFDQQHGDFLDRLAAAGVQPEDVHRVINTHRHNDQPDHGTCLSEDEAEATRSRRRVLEQAAATNSLVVPAHWGGAAEIVRSNGAFSIRGWAPLSGP